MEALLVRSGCSSQPPLACSSFALAWPKWRRCESYSSYPVWSRLLYLTLLIVHPLLEANCRFIESGILSLLTYTALYSHWVSEFAPAKFQKILSYTVGWLCVLGWQSALVGCSFTVAQQFEALIALCDDTYIIQGWHGALLSIGVCIFAILFNVLLIRKMPLMQGVVFFLHVAGFFAFVIVLWVLGPRANAKEVFTTFSNNGWGNDGVSCLVGILAPVVTLIGADSSCHLSEELRDAAWVLPRAMLTTAVVNYFLGIFMTITLMFVLGDIDKALSSPTGMPYVEVIYNATQSKGATIAMLVVTILLLVACTINQVTTSSRQLFAFARDGGMPFHKFLSRVRPGWDIPINALVVSLLITVVLSCIVIGSPIAYAIILSLSETGLLSSYIIAIGCILWRRASGEPFPTSRFSLGKWGYPVNAIAVSFLTIVWVFMFFPSAPNPTAETMNWSVVVFGAVVIFFIIWYFVRAKHVYVGPVAHVDKEL